MAISRHHAMRIHGAAVRTRIISPTDRNWGHEARSASVDPPCARRGEARRSRGPLAHRSGHVRPIRPLLAREGTTRHAGRYRTGASACASLAALSTGASTAETTTGRWGMCAWGPQADPKHRPRTAMPRRLIRKTMPHCALGPLRVTIRAWRPGATIIPGQYEIIQEGQCASRARLRITQCKRST